MGRLGECEMLDVSAILPYISELSQQVAGVRSTNTTNLMAASLALSLHMTADKTTIIILDRFAAVASRWEFCIRAVDAQMRIILNSATVVLRGTQFHAPTTAQ